MTTKTATWGEASPGQNSIDAGFSGFVARIRQAWARRQTHLMLADLDARTLDDLGLDPGHARRSRMGMVDWVVQTHSGGTARLVFIGR